MSAPSSWSFATGLTVRSVQTERELEEVFRLRYRVFAQVLHWIPENTSRLDRDSYDARATLVGVFCATRGLLGTIRVLFRPERFMLDKEFSCLLSPGDGTVLADAELSRMCIAPFYQGSDQGRHIAMKLLHHAHALCLRQGVEAADFVSTPAYLKSLVQRGFSCKVLGGVRSLDGGVPSVAARLQWSESSADVFGEMACSHLENA